MPKNIQHFLCTIQNELSALFSRTDFGPAGHIADLVLSSPAVFPAGAGRSGLLLRCAAMRLMHLGLTVHIPGDTLTPPIRRGDLLLAASGSGETAGLVVMAEKARAAGASLALVTARPDSSLARLADACLVLPAPTLKAESNWDMESSQPMGSLFEQAMFLFFEALTRQLMQRLNLSSAEMFGRHANLE